MRDIIPAILESEWEEVAKKIALVSPHVDWVQIDIADGTLSPQKTLTTFDKFVQLGQLVKLAKMPSFEAHLMVADPTKYIRPLVDAGFKRLIAQVESTDPRLFLDEAVMESVEVGLAIDGVTPIETIEPFLETLDVVLVMLADAGTKEESVSAENIEKIRSIHSHFSDLPIAVEEGITAETIKVLRDAGATRFVPNDFLFKDGANIAAAIEQLKKV